MIHSFLLIGQSNAAGRGYLHEAEPLETCDGRLLVARNGLWLKMFRPVNPDRKFSGTCLAETFAKAYAEANPDVQVGIIPCADGGTRLDEWQPGEILFDNAVHCARLAMRTSRLMGILWHQGEGDCEPALYPLYAEKLQRMIDGLRAALGMPEIPILLGGLGEFLKDHAERDFLKNYVHINDALQRVADADPRCAYVSAVGLTGNPDNLHFNAASLATFGYRYFDVWKTLPVSDNETATSAPSTNTERTALAQL
jgi:hypothetical protein